MGEVWDMNVQRALREPEEDRARTEGVRYLDLVDKVTFAQRFRQYLEKKNWMDKLFWPSASLRDMMSMVADMHIEPAEVYCLRCGGYVAMMTGDVWKEKLMEQHVCPRCALPIQVTAVVRTAEASYMGAEARARLVYMPPVDGRRLEPVPVAGGFTVVHGHFNMPPAE